MPITHGWYIENHIIKVDLYGIVRIEEFRQLSSELITLFESPAYTGIQNIHIIADDGEVTEPPKKVWEIVNSTGFLKHEKMGWLLLYGTNRPFNQFLSKMVTQLVGVNFRSVTDFEMALKHLETADTGIQWND